MVYKSGAGEDCITRMEVAVFLPPYSSIEPLQLKLLVTKEEIVGSGTARCVMGYWSILRKEKGCIWSGSRSHSLW